MKRAPLASLRSLWAHGGSAAAWMARDEALRASLERIARQGDVGESLVEEDACRPLVATFSFGDVLPAGVAAESTEDAEFSSGPTSTRGLRATKGAPPPLGRETIRETSRARLAGHEEGSVSPSIRRREGGGERGPAPNDAAEGPVRKATLRAANAVPVVRTRSANTANSRTVPAPAALGAPHRDTLPMAGPVRRELEADVTVRVARLLSRYSTPEGGRAVGEMAATRQTPARQSNDAGTMQLLTRVVERVERRVTERLRERQSAEHVRARGTDGEVERAQSFARAAPEIFSPTGGASTVPAWAPTSNSRRGGLRGLAEHAAGTIERSAWAPLLPRTPNDDRVPWPEGDLDGFATMLDAAARRDGVDLDEVTS